jgi:hypothetical protein
MYKNLEKKLELEPWRWFVVRNPTKRMPLRSGRLSQYTRPEYLRRFK